LKRLKPLFVFLVLAAPPTAADFPPVTDEERALASVPGEPNAPAVVLFKKGEFLMMGYGLRSKTAASHLRVQEVLGDESSLAPSTPLGPATQPFVQPSSSRKTMVMFDFAHREEVELRLRWPAGWKPESLPKPAAVDNEVGVLAASVELKDDDRSLVYRRRFDLVRRVLRSPREYERAQLLFAEAEKSDAQPLVLVRR
jgi:hypothetical protein